MMDGLDDGGGVESWGGIIGNTLPIVKHDLGSIAWLVWESAELSWSDLGTSTSRRLPTRVEANADDFVRRVLVERRVVSSGRPFLALIQRPHVVGPWTRTPRHEQQSQIRITDRAIVVTGDRNRFFEDRIPVCPWFGTGDRAQGEKTGMPGTGWFS